MHSFMTFFLSNAESPVGLLGCVQSKVSSPITPFIWRLPRQS